MGRKESRRPVMSLSSLGTALWALLISRGPPGGSPPQDEDVGRAVV